MDDSNQEVALADLTGVNDTVNGLENSGRSVGNRYPKVKP
jgi:hypothetical protein